MNPTLATPVVAPRRKPSFAVFLAIYVGTAFQLMALVCSLVTLSTQDYRSTLLIAMGTTLSAALCLAYGWRKGGAIARVAAVVVALPSLFVIFEFARRAPGTFF